MSTSASPGRSRLGCGAGRRPGWSGRRRRATAELHRPLPTRPAAPVVAVGGVQGEDLRRARCAQLADPGRGRADQERLGDLAEGEELASPPRSWLAAPGAACPAGHGRSARRRCWPHPARPAACSATTSPVNGSTTCTRPSVTVISTAGADQPVRDRVAGRAEPDAGQLVDLAADRLRPDLGPQRRQRPRAAPAPARAARPGPRRSPNASRR